MAIEHCAVCNGTFEEGELLFSDSGKVCAMCELELTEATTRTKGVWVTVVSGPITAVCASVMLCVPYVGFLGAGVISVMALWRAIVALQVYWYSRNATVLGGTERGALLASGVVSLVWSIAILLAALGTGLVTLFRSLA